MSAPSDKPHDPITLSLHTTVRLPSARQVPILANPRAGTGKSRRLVEALAGALRRRGLTPTVCWQREELSELLHTLDPNAVRCVVAAGGDGTLLEVVNRAPHLPAALLPLGNENLVAQYCRLERCASRLADVIAAGHTQRFDLARAGDRFFCLMASAGLDADVVHRVHRRRRGHISRLTYVVPTLQALQSYPYPLMEATVEETGERLRGALVFVFNVPLYGLRLPIAPEARPDDGWLDLCVFERPGVVNLARYLAALISRQRDCLPDFHYRRVRCVRIESVPPAPVQTDGDPAGRLPVTIEVVPGALTLMVPPPPLAQGGTA
ncbi:MAG TPA: diacylglycerol kinase family protein [Gemmataceae bacterium]|nr:diacylglycerol kinase family protein [Gemmataceae bacterium]